VNPLKSINFRFLVIANSFAFLGWVIRNLLVNWYVLEKTDSTTLVGLFAAVPSVVMFFFGPLGGQLADKYSRKSVLVYTRLASCIIFFLLALFVHIELYVMYLIFICLIFVGVQEGMEAPSERNLIIDIVGLKYLTLGNSIAEFFNSFINSVGPLFVALLLISVENVHLFWSLPLVQTISLIFAVLLFLNFKNPIPDNSQIYEKKSKSIKEGIHYSFNHVNIRILLILATTVFFWGVSQPLIPKIARDVLHIGQSGYGILIAAEGFGWMLGSILLSISPKLFRNSKSILVCIAMYAFSMILFALSGNFAVSIICLILGGIFHLIWWTVIIIMLQTLSDNLHRGRVIGLFFALTQINGLGFIIGGWSGENFGIFITIISSSFCLTAIHLIVFMISRKFRSLRT